jgi:hypothetical protein
MIQRRQCYLNHVRRVKTRQQPPVHSHHHHPAQRPAIPTEQLRTGLLVTLTDQGEQLCRIGWLRDGRNRAS